MYTNFCVVLASLSFVVIVAASKGTKLSAVKLLTSRGSGDDLEDDDDDVEGSAEVKPSECHRLRSNLRNSKIRGAYIPQCTPGGEFNPVQCTDSKEPLEECFCVDILGQEVPGTRSRHPKRPDCSNIDRAKYLVAVTRRATWPLLPMTVSTTRATRKEEPTAVGVKSKPDPSAKAEEMENDQGTSAQGRKSTSPSNDGWVYVKTRPTLLAGIIGGIAVGLLCAMLLVLFIIYRLRKKDEGSYALDEPKNSPAVAYTKAHDREFFA